jgi:hypothetical protein
MKKNKKDDEHWFDIGMLSNFVTSRIETRYSMTPEQAIEDAKKEQDWIDRDIKCRKGIK